jgi:uncharacterized protein YeaO (DUF488 family)
MIRVKSIHEPASPDDAFRVLVEPVWPKKVSREKTLLNVWLRDLAPSRELAARFAGNQLTWQDFVRRYHTELARNHEYFRDLQEHNHNGGLTLVHGSHDPDRNPAAALKMLLEQEDRAAFPGEYR